MAVPARPHIVLIHTDQQRYRSLRCTGNPHADAPNLEGLAREATLFHRHIAANPVCMPSRASLFTGRYPNAHGVWLNGVALPRREYVPMAPGQHEDAEARQVVSEVPTLADVFAAAGYQTAAAGKLHFTPTLSASACGYPECAARWDDPRMEDWHGPYYGFQQVDLAISHGEGAKGHYGFWLRKAFPELERRRHEPPASWPFPEQKDLYAGALPVEAHHSTWVAERAAARIEAADDARPLFLFAGFPDPHHPFTPPAELAREFARRDVLDPVWSTPEDAARKPEGFRALGTTARAYMNAARLPPGCVRLIRQHTEAMVHLIDRGVGRILQAIRARGWWEKTIVIFTSDHGDLLGDHGLIKKDTICCDALVRVPFLMRVPGAGWPAECRAPVSNTDVLPTLCALADVALPEGVQGRDFSGVVQGAAAPPPPVGVVAYQRDPRYHNFSLYDDRHRYTYYPATRERELYDHGEDPHEFRNVASEPERRETVERLHRELLEFHARTDNPSVGRVTLW